MMPYQMLGDSGQSGGFGPVCLHSLEVVMIDLAGNLGNVHR